MYSLNKRMLESDEEEDLEVLRLAALKSLRKPEPAPMIAPSVLEHSAPVVFNLPVYGGPPKCVKRGRFHGNGRIPRNGSYNNRVRNYNLISVPTVESDAVPDQNVTKKLADQPAPKLILPQDRYCSSKVAPEEKASECSSKFDRYNNSDESGTDSESEQEKVSEVGSPKKIERSNSLEALLQELEYEIQGGSKQVAEVEKPEIKTKTKVKKLKTEKADVVNDDKKEEILETKCVIEEKQPVIEKENKKTVPAIVKPECDRNCFGVDSTFKPVTSQTNVLKTAPLHPMPYPNPQMSVVPTPPPYPPVYPLYTPPVVYNTSLPYPFPNLPSQIEPARNIRPLSPLAINTDILNTIAAPLSPRSAAFVLQNREIIERRKKSPKHSYSHSPSPEYRGPPSPRYRRSPKWSPKVSPVHRASPIRNNRRLSPKSNSRHESPHRHKHTRDANKSEENKNIQTRNVVPSRSPTPDCLNRSDSPTEAVLEARRKKFETGNAVATEGVIRLKPKTTEEENIAVAKEPEQEEKDEKEESEDLQDVIIIGNDEIDLGLTITPNDIFSDDESNSDNEGRFKSARQETNRVSMVPFTQLLNETSKMIRKDGHKSRKTTSSSQSHLKSNNHNKDKQRSYSPNESEVKKKSLKNSERKSIKNHLKLKIDTKVKRRKPPIVSPIENKKIEIRIRNPSKYESTTNNTKDSEIESIRKVEVSSFPSNIEDAKPAKTSRENDDDSKNEGDLRTQLSRKRAERQNKLPTVDGVQSRLLQSALQGAIYKKSRKISKEKDIAPLDGKLPIHLRLGIPGSLEIFSEAPVQKNSRKRNKSRANLEQV